MKLSLLTLAVCLLIALPGTAGAQSDPCSISGLSALDLSGSAKVVDGPGNAQWIQLTAAENWQKGAAILKTPFAMTDQGLQVTFEYLAYGGSNADGLALFLYDATKAGTPSVGGPGGCLGYSGGPDATTCAQAAGVANGVLGIGLDVLGNNSTAIGGAGGLTEAKPNSVVLRGDQASGYKRLSTLDNLFGMKLATSSSEPRKVIVTIRPAASGPDHTVEVWFDEGGGTSVAAPVPSSLIPAKVGLGFSAGTGTMNAVHMVGNLSCGTPAPAS